MHQGWTKSRSWMSRLLLAAVAALCLSHCGKDNGKSSKVNVSIVPDTPIAINAPIKVNGEDMSGPWFQFSVGVTNDSDDTVTIVAMQVDIAIYDSTGTELTASTSFVPSEGDTTVTDSSDNTYECTYEYFAEIAPHTTATVYLTPRDMGDNVIPPCPPGSTRSIFYVHSLPLAGGSFRYRVKLKPIGWFGSFASPSDRFEKVVNFHTQ